MTTPIDPFNLKPSLFHIAQSMVRSAASGDGTLTMGHVIPAQGLDPAPGLLGAVDVASTHQRQAEIPMGRAFVPVRTSPPRYISETWEQVYARLPELRSMDGLSLNDHAAKVFDMVDTLPGYQLLQYLTPAQPQHAAFVFRLREVSRAPVNLATF